MTAEDMALCFTGRRAVSLTQRQRVIEDATGKVASTLRASLGLVSNFADVHRLVEFLASFREG